MFIDLFYENVFWSILIVWIYVELDWNCVWTLFIVMLGSKKVGSENNKMPVLACKNYGMCLVF